MFPISNTTLQLLKNGAKQEIDMTIELANGDTLTLDNNDIVRGSLVVDRYVCEEKVTIGNAIASELTFTLVNANNVYEDINFEKAVITLNIVVGEETIKMGKFICEKPTQMSTTIKIEALDSMTKFDIPCPTNYITEGALASEVVEQIVDDFSLEGYVIDNNLANINATLEDFTLPSNLTFRKLIQMLAELFGGNAYFDYNNYLHFSTYIGGDTLSLTPNDRYSSNYNSSVTIDGIKVINLDATYVSPSNQTSDSYVSGTTFHLGTGASVINQKLTFSSLFKNSISIQNKKAIFGGWNTRPIEVVNNVLINNQPYVDEIYEAITGGNVLNYVPFQATVKPLPHVFPMDLVEFTTKDGNVFTSFVTHIRYICNKNNIVESCGQSDYQTDTSTIPQAYLTNEELNDSDSVSHRIVTTITEDTIATTNIIAEHLQVRVANILGTITANDILVKDSDNNVIFSANADTKSVTMDLSKMTINGVASFISTNDLQTSNGVTTIIGNTVTTGFVNALGITAKELLVEDSSHNVVFHAYSGTNTGGDNSYCTIGGFTATDTMLKTTNTLTNGLVGLYSGELLLVPSLVTSGDSSLRFFAGNTGSVDGSRFMVLDDGSVYCSAINITGGAITGTTLELTYDSGASPLYGGQNDIITKTLIDFSELFLYRPISHDVGNFSEFPLYIPINSFRYQATDYVLLILVMSRPNVSQNWQLGTNFEFTIMTKTNYQALVHYSYDDDIHGAYSGG